jgi:tetratricopeptide (TPR) repeat protein
MVEDKSYLKRQQEKVAINLAMEGRWDEAVAANKDILESFPDDIEALNRLGRALMELGRYAEAMSTYNKTLSKDPDNIIARKNIDKLSFLIEEGKADSQGVKHEVAPQLFIEETGKTGTVALVHLATKKVLAKFSPGEQVSLVPKGAHLQVMSMTGEYLGEVGARHAHRLIRLMEGGNKYSAAIASMGDGVKVIIKEIYQHPSQKGRLSFPVKGTEGLRPYVKESVLRYELEGEDEFLSEEGEFPAEEEETKESEFVREGISIVEEGQSSLELVKEDEEKAGEPEDE